MESAKIIKQTKDYVEISTLSGKEMPYEWYLEVAKVSLETNAIVRVYQGHPPNGGHEAFERVFNKSKKAETA
jgi:hypothetical protein